MITTTDDIECTVDWESYWCLGECFEIVMPYFKRGDPVLS